MNEFSLILLSTIVILGVWLLVYYIQWRKDNDRREAMEKVARDRMFTFTEKTTQTGRLQDFYLQSRGRRHTIRNQMQGQVDGVALTLFDYRFTVGSGKSSKKLNQTVFEFETPNLDLVGFTIRPNQFFDGLAERFGKKSIEMHDETFNKRFNVYPRENGEANEEAIRALITADVRHAMLRQSHQMVVEGYGNRLLIWRQNERVKVEQMERAIGEAKSLFDMIADSVGWSWKGENRDQLSFGDAGWSQREKQPEDLSFGSDDDWGGWKK